MSVVSRRKFAATMVDYLIHWARDRPNSPSFVFLSGPNLEETTISYGKLASVVEKLAQEMRSSIRTSDRVVLAMEQDLGFVVAFLATLWAGGIAVPVPPPRRKSKSQSFARIIHNCEPKLVLTDEKYFEGVTDCINFERAKLEVRKNCYSELINSPVAGEISSYLGTHYCEPQNLAVLQYTSGSTGRPKGVMVSHANLVENQHIIAECFGHHENTIFAGWLPFFHDMGLAGNLCQSLYLGCKCVLFPPTRFVAEPIFWLKAISRHRVTTSGGPNFAYEHCARRIDLSQCKNEQIDLSSWTTAFVGSEPIRPTTLTAFVSKFEPLGFSPASIFPCYGMAETTLLITSRSATECTHTVRSFDRQSVEKMQPRIPESEIESVNLVSCGEPQGDFEIKIIHPRDLSECATGEIGEIWVRGKCVAKGYWNNTTATEETFCATIQGKTDGNEYLRTGDLGFLCDGQLYVTGRQKEVIIVRGRNIYPQDIEEVVENATNDVALGGSIAFPVLADTSEGYGVRCELTRAAWRRMTEEQVKTLERILTGELVKEFGVPPNAITFCRPGGIEKTTSGKKKRLSEPMSS